MSCSLHLWLPPLSNGQVDAVRSILEEVTARLTDEDVLRSAVEAAASQSSVPGLVRWEPGSLAHGSAGMAVLCSYFDACLPGCGWDVLGRRHLEAAAGWVERTGGPSPSLFGGLCATGYAAFCLSRNGQRFRKLSRAIDDALEWALTPLISRVVDSEDGVGNHDYDVVTGLAGVGAYLLCRLPDDKCRLLVESVAMTLAGLSGCDEAIPRWYTPARLLRDESMALAHPGGVLNCGLSHGIPGPLAFLSLASREGLRSDPIHRAIRNWAEWLANNRHDDAWGINWPTAVSVLGYTNGQRPRPSCTAWCYGSPGIARALWLAGTALESTAFRDLAVASMEAVLRKPVPARGINSPTFCHGVAGLLEITLRFWADTGMPVFSQGASDLVDQLIDAYEPGSILGYRSEESGGRLVDNAGLLDGAQGVALTLLASTSEVDPYWDRIFLLS